MKRSKRLIAIAMSAAMLIPAAGVSASSGVETIPDEAVEKHVGLEAEGNHEENTEAFAGEDTGIAGTNTNASVDEAAMEESEVFLLSSQKQTADGFKYDLIDGGVKITGYVGETSSYIVVPGTIEGYNVLEIGNSVFKGTDLETIILPDSIRKIGISVFENCKSLKSIKLPSSLESIGSYCFDGTDITEINIPAKVESASSPFSKAKNLTTVTFDSGMKTIPANILNGANAVTTINMPDGVTKIGNGAFKGTSIETILLPDSIREIGISSFEKCESLKKVVFRGSLEEWNQISIRSYNDKLTEADLECLNQKPSNAFIDVNNSDWFYDAVNYVSEKGYMTGMAESVFGPAEILARAQFACIIYRMEGSPAVSFYDKFADVPSGTWYSDAVIWANNSGVVSGYQDGNFGPADSITREQLAVMLYRYAQYKGFDTGNKADISNYPDRINVSDWATEAMQWAVGNGIITGKEGGQYLDAGGNASRAECAVMIMRFAQKYGLNM